MRDLRANELQARIDSTHVTLTACEGGRVRLAIPAQSLTGRQTVLLQRALHGRRAADRPNEMAPQSRDWADSATGAIASISAPIPT